MKPKFKIVYPVKLGKEGENELIGPSKRKKVKTETKIENLINERLNVGRHSILWNADSYSAGTYLLKIKAGHQVDTRKLVLIK